MPDRLWLVGMMGSGKSSVGAAVARRLGLEHHDTDALIEARAGMAVHEIFETVGVVAFRDLERQAVEQIATTDGIISTGGGAVLDERSRTVMRDTGAVVYLAAAPETLLRRVGDVGSRPLLHTEDPLQTLSRILEERDPVYRMSADVVVDTEGKRRSDVVEEVVETWNAS